MRRGEFFQVRFWQHFESSLNVAMPLLLVAALVLVAVFLLQTLGWVGALAVAVVAAPFEYAGVRALLDLRRRNRRPGGSVVNAVRPVDHALAVFEEFAARAERQGNAWAVRLARIHTHRLVPGADLTLVRRGRPRKAAA